MDLDEMLKAAAPPVAKRSTELAHELRAVVVGAEPRRAPRRRRAMLGSLGALAVAAGGWGVANAAGLVGGPDYHWTSAAGSECQVSFRADPVVTDPTSPLYWGDPPLPKHVDRAVQDRTLVDARGFVASFDFSSISDQEAVAAWEAEQVDLAARGYDTPKEIYDLEVQMGLELIVRRQAESYLRAHGDDARYVEISSQGKGADGCFVHPAIGPSSPPSSAPPETTPSASPIGQAGR